VRGALRFAQGYFTDTTSSAVLPRGCTKSGTTSEESALNSASARSVLRAECEARAATHDVVYHNLAIGGSTAEGWASTGACTSVGSDWGDPIDWLVVQFGTNDVANAVDPNDYYDAMLARLNEWTNVRRKFVALAWVWDGQWGDVWPAEAATRDAYFAAALSAAQDCDVGLLQGDAGFVPTMVLGGSGHVAKPGSANWASYDDVHLTRAGVDYYLARWLRWSSGIGLGAMRP
jgi:hypothetical protein